MQIRLQFSTQLSQSVSVGLHQLRDKFNWRLSSYDVYHMHMVHVFRIRVRWACRNPSLDILTKGEAHVHERQATAPLAPSGEGAKWICTHATASLSKRKDSYLRKTSTLEFHIPEQQLTCACSVEPWRSGHKCTVSLHISTTPSW